MNDMEQYGLHYYSTEREHVASEDCWCEPELEYRDPETGVTVYVHRLIQ